MSAAATPACSDCGAEPGRTPIAHIDALDEPIGHLCIRCYSLWVGVVEPDAGCLVCGTTAVFRTVRDVSLKEDGSQLLAGYLGFCEEHALSFSSIRVGPEVG